MDLTVIQTTRFHFEKGKYAEIDKLYETYRNGTERFKDGRWKLVQLEEAIEHGFIYRDTWKKRKLPCQVDISKVEFSSFASSC
jgi:hypothetical protein